MEVGFQKTSRNFSRKIMGRRMDDPPIFVISRRRGHSYKAIPLAGLSSQDVFYAPVSSGFSMQDASSYIMGPVVGEGLNLTNAAYSKIITVMHIQGGGRVDYRSKSFGKPGKAIREVQVTSPTTMLVDGSEVLIKTWLESNKALWFEEWNLWARSIAMCSRAEYRWGNQSVRVGYWLNDQCVDFLHWKIECILKPSYRLLEESKSARFLKEVRAEGRTYCLGPSFGAMTALGAPITVDLIKTLYQSSHSICGSAYVLAGYLLDVPIDSENADLVEIEQGNLDEGIVDAEEEG